jgi:hypothetical protein
VGRPTGDFQALRQRLTGGQPQPPPQPRHIGEVAVTVNPQVNPQAVHIARENTRGAPQAPGQVAVEIPGLGRTVDISLAMLPEGLRGLPDIARLLGEKIVRGGAHFRDISAGNIPDHLKPDYTGALTREEQFNKASMISDLAFFLQAQGEAKAGPFSEGAFSLPDPDGNILKFLTSYPHSYRRSSSHLEDLKAGGQTGTKANPGVEHYGLDLHGDGTSLDTILPNGRGTILFGKMPASLLSARDTGSPGLGEVRGDRLFLKIEPHGTGGGGVDAVLRNPPGQTRGTMQKIGDFFGHAGGWIKSVCRRMFGNNSPAGSHKERIPPQMKSDYQAIVKLVGKAVGLTRQEKTIIKDHISARNFGGDSQGLRTMLLNLGLMESNAVAELRDNPGNAALWTAIDKFKADWSPENGFDHPELRIGQEIILTDLELRGGALPPPQPRPLPGAHVDKLLTHFNQVCQNGALGLYNKESREGNGSRPDSAMIQRRDQVQFADGRDTSGETHMSRAFAADFPRYDFTIGVGDELIVGKDVKGEGNKLTEDGYDRIKNFFHSQYPDTEAGHASGDYAMRLVTSMANQNSFNFLSTEIMKADPEGALVRLGGAGGPLGIYPNSQHHVETKRSITANEDGTFSLRITIAKKPRGDMSELEKFCLRDSGFGDRIIQLDPDHSDFHFEYEIRIDPRAGVPHQPGAPIGPPPPVATLVSASGFERLYDISGNLIHERTA